MRKDWGLVSMHCIKLPLSMSALDQSGGGGMGREAGIALCIWPPLPGHCRHTGRAQYWTDSAQHAAARHPMDFDVCARLDRHRTRLDHARGTLTPENLAALRVPLDWTAEPQKPPRATFIRLQAL